MRRIMLIKIHMNNYSIKSTDFGHNAKLKKSDETSIILKINQM